ncbi:hypothetical protein QEN19_001252 [Hanseniaspora menglaensis]
MSVTMARTKIPTFHIVGLGSMGSIIAIALQKKFPSYKIVPILRNQEKVEFFKKKYDSKFVIHRQYNDNKIDISQSFEETTSLDHVKEDHIDNLIITTKTYQSIDALKPLWDKIDNKTNIILIQNGFGSFEALSEAYPEIIKDNYKVFQGVIAHAVFGSSAQFNEFYHAAFLDLKVAQINGFDLSKSSKIQSIDEVNKMVEENDLCNTLKDIDLGVSVMSYQELIVGQIKKFCVNCCINGLTSILNCMNGDFKYEKETTMNLFEDVAQEVIDVFALDPNMKKVFEYENKPGMPAVDLSFSKNIGELSRWIYKIGVIDCGGNSSSMRQDVINKRGTEIDFINGYVCSLATKLNLPRSAYKVNQTAVNLHKIKCEIIKNDGIN